VLNNWSFAIFFSTGQVMLGQRFQMVSCAAFGCNNRGTKGNGLSFYSFPKDGQLRKAWIHNCRRWNFDPTSGVKIHIPRPFDASVVLPWECVGVEQLEFRHFFSSVGSNSVCIELFVNTGYFILLIGGKISIGAQVTESNKI
jgi:hypothetical protein